MSKMKIVIIAISLFGAAVLVLVLLIFWAFFGRSIKINVQAMLKTPAAKAAAAGYIEKKYGEKAVFSKAEPITRASGYIFPERYFVGIELTADNYTVMVYFNEDEPVIIDDRQYDEICSAVKEHFFDDKSLGYSYEINNFSLDFYKKLEDGIHDRRDTRFTSVYFDGDIEKFLREATAEISADVTYEGYPEKRNEYRNILNNKLEYIYPFFGEEGSLVYLFIHDPNVNLPEIKNKYVNSSRIYHIPRYEEYMELIACGYTSKDGIKVLQTEWYDIDEFTAISCEFSPVLSDNAFIFGETDLSDNTTVYRGVYKYDDRAEENILQIRDISYIVDLTDRKSGGNTVFLRLDRNHYGITDKTVPLLVADGTGNWQGKRLYTSIGYGSYDSKELDWYYFDDNYIYLYINGMHVDVWDAYLAFADV